MIKQLRQWWRNFQLWWWTRGMDVLDVTKEAPLVRDALHSFLDKDPLVRQTLQGLRKAEIDEPAPYILPERPRWLEECLKTGKTEDELIQGPRIPRIVRTSKVTKVKGVLKNEQRKTTD